MMDLQWYDWVGLVGTLMVLAAYFMLQAGRLHGNGMLYQVLNLFGAAGVLASLYGTFNLSVDGRVDRDQRIRIDAHVQGHGRAEAAGLSIAPVGAASAASFLTGIIGGVGAIQVATLAICRSRRRSLPQKNLPFAIAQARR